MPSVGCWSLAAVRSRPSALRPRRGGGLPRGGKRAPSHAPTGGRLAVSVVAQLPRPGGSTPARSSKHTLQSGAASEPRKPSLAAALSVNVSVAAFFLFCSDTALAANTDLQPQMVTALAEEATGRSVPYVALSITWIFLASAFSFATGATQGNSKYGGAVKNLRETKIRLATEERKKEIERGNGHCMWAQTLNTLLNQSLEETNATLDSTMNTTEILFAEIKDLKIKLREENIRSEKRVFQAKALKNQLEDAKAKAAQLSMQMQTYEWDLKAEVSKNNSLERNIQTVLQAKDEELEVSEMERAQLSVSLDRLKKEHAEATSAAAASQEECSRLQDRLDYITAQYAEVRDELDVGKFEELEASELERSQLAVSLERLTKDHAEALEIAATTQKECQRLQAELETMTSQYQDVKVKLEANLVDMVGREELEASQKQLATSQKELDLTRTQLKESISAKDRLTEDLKVGREELEASQKKLETSQKELELTQTKLKESISAGSTYEAQLETLTSQYQEVKAQYQEVKAQYEEVKEKLDITLVDMVGRGELEASQKQLETSQKELDLAQMQLKESILAKDRLTEDLKVGREELEASQKKLETSQKELELTQTKLKESVSAGSTYEAQLETLTSQYQEVKAQYKEVKEKLDITLVDMVGRGELEASQKQLETSQKELDLAQMQLKESILAKDRLTEDLKRANADNSSLQSLLDGRQDYARELRERITEVQRNSTLTEAFGGQSGGAVSERQRLLDQIAAEVKRIKREESNAATRVADVAALQRDNRGKEELLAEIKSLKAALASSQIIPIMSSATTQTLEQMQSLALSTEKMLAEKFPEKSFKGVTRKELTKLKAYANYMARNKKLSSTEEKMEDWASALQEITDLAARGATEVDFMAMFCRTSADLISKGDWSQFSVGGGSDDTDVRRAMLVHFFSYFANDIPATKLAPEQAPEATDTEGSDDTTNRNKASADSGDPVAA